MRIVQIPRRFVASCWGGTETVILETSRRLLSMGHETYVLCSNALANEDSEVMAGVPIRRVPYFYPYLGLSRGARRELDQRGGNLFSLSLMRELWKDEGLDLVHLHTGKRFGGAARSIARLRRLPYVVSLHGGFLEVPTEEASRYVAPTRGAFEWGRALGWLVGSRRVLDDAAAIICVSRGEQRRLSASFPSQRIFHLPNGVDVARFASGDGSGFRRRHRIPSSSFLMVTVGRIDPQKNQLLALSVLERLRAARVDAHLALVGPSTNDGYARALSDAIEERRLAPHVTLTGNLALDGAELVDAYHAADLFLLPSIHEPFGIVLLEAWAANRPVLAAAVGGIPDFVSDGVNGSLFSCGDEERAAALALALARNRTMRQALAAAGRTAVSEYSWERITSRLVEIYREVSTRNVERRRRVKCA